MARFYAQIHGSAGIASRQGTISSGMWGHIRGYNAGCRVECSVIDGHDVVTVWATGGSNSASSDRLIATIREDGITLHYGHQRLRLRDTP